MLASILDYRYSKFEPTRNFGSKFFSSSNLQVSFFPLKQSESKTSVLRLNLNLELFEHPTGSSLSLEELDSVFPTWEVGFEMV